MVASADSAVVAGGDEVRSGNLTFHYRTEEDFNVVTWTIHGLSYRMPWFPRYPAQPGNPAWSAISL
jgi:hypothetical protein